MHKHSARHEHTARRHYCLFVLCQTVTRGRGPDLSSRLKRSAFEARLHVGIVHSRVSQLLRDELSRARAENVVSAQAAVEPGRRRE